MFKSLFCRHEFKIAGHLGDYTVDRPHFKNVLYCPKCSKIKMVSDEHWTIIRNIQEIQKEWNKK